MSIAIRRQVNNQILASMYERLSRAYAKGQQRLVKRMHGLVYIIDGKDI